MMPLLLAAAAVLLPCSYRAAGDEEIAPRGPCATSTAEGVRIEPKHLRRLEYGRDGLAGVFVDGVGWVYVKRGGETLVVLAQDNGPDDFSDDRVRVSRGGKIGYADRSFRVVISPRYDFAWPFERGRALVCVGCKAAPADPAHEGHAAVVGGRWGYVDHAGREIVPVERAREEILALPDQFRGARRRYNPSQR
jgi:WG containing repeat